MKIPHVSLQGQLLLDGGRLRGSFFHRSVVLVCQHDMEGAFGLVLNRTTKKNIGEVIEDIPDSLRKHPLYLGGPVQPGAFCYLHGDNFLPSGNVMRNLELGYTLEDLAKIVGNFSPTRKVRVFAGYAGWSPGQLDAEMANNAWLTHPASMDLVFRSDTGSLWNHILGLKNWRHRLLAQSPEDLSWN